MVYKPLAVRVALIAGFRRPLPVFRYMIVVAVAVVMWESPQGFPRGVGRVESRLYGFPCFPYPGISMACFSAAGVCQGTCVRLQASLLRCLSEGRFRHRRSHRIFICEPHSLALRSTTRRFSTWCQKRLPKDGVAKTAFYPKTAVFSSEALASLPSGIPLGTCGWGI